MGGDWIDTAGWNDDGDVPAPSIPPPGQRQVAVVCCPACQSLDVARYSTAASTSYWRCAGCADTWKLPATVGRDRAYLF